jgi:hypothetical protein
MMESFCQRDLRWASDKIKGTDLTIGRSGCTITCLADLSTYFGDNLTPAQINETCNFTSGGLIIWASARFGHFSFVKREYGRDDTEIARAIKDPLLAVILQVANASHWVVGVEVYPNNGIFKIADPWLGDWSSMVRYWNNITGAAYFKRI